MSDLGPSWPFCFFFRATVTVHLLNENDNIPQFNSSVYHFDAKENNSVPVLLGQILATDADGDRLIYGCDNTGMQVLTQEF